MVYIIFNILLSISLIFFTNQVSKKIKDQTITVVSLSVAMLFSVIASVLFSVILIVKEFDYSTFVSIAMRLVLAVEGFAMTVLSFALIEMGCKTQHKIATFFKYLAYAFIIYVVFFKFDVISLSGTSGIMISSEFLTKNFFTKYVPIRWLDLYVIVIKYILPIIGFLFLALLQERHNATQLEKFQTFIIGAAFIFMWLISISIEYIAKASLNTSYLYMFAYAYMYIIIYSGLTQTTVPSGRAMFVSIFKVLVSYFLPAIVVGIFVAIFQPQATEPKSGFIAIFSVVGGLLILLALKLNDILSASSRLYTADYGAGLEKELAAVEYREADMDVITAGMFEILKKNAETSSLNVYIMSEQKELETAYSSNNLKQKISVDNSIFDALLNINKNIVIYSEIEKEHSLAGIQDELKSFFEYTKSDALFILNEGHNIFGIITLGKKISGDHFKSYDYNVFEKLYSYFFVFGYYMRNIANKDIIGIVNREIRMSSQIITSIQENIDRVKCEKVDIGYVMVPAHNIGGEFIDLIRLTDTRHLFVVGDLSGKGIGASMNMVILKSIIRTHLAEIHDFKELVVRLNTFVRDSLPKGTIFSGLFALVDFETDTMYYINCGIPALMLYTQVYNNVIEIQGSGHVLGFVKDIAPYLSVKTTKLNPGDILLACTDGLVQSHSLRGEQFGKERIQQSILDNASYNAQRMAQFTFDGLTKFMTKEMEDDVSILVMKYGGTANAETETSKEAEESETEEPKTEEENAATDNDNIDIDAKESEAEIEEPEEVTEDTSSASEAGSSDSNVENVESNYSDSGEENKKEPDEVDLDLPDFSDIDDIMKEAGL